MLSRSRRVGPGFSGGGATGSSGSNVRSVPDIAALVALAAVVVGQRVRVETVGRAFEAAPPGTSPVTVGELGVIDGVGSPVQWHNLAGSSDPKWRAQAAWFVDVSVGNDENTGAIGAPLASPGEIQLRWGTTNPVLDTVTITFQGPLVPRAIRFEFTPASATSQLIVRGVPVTAAGGVVATYADRNMGANTWCRLTSPAVIDWTPEIGRRIQYTTGPAAGATAWLLKVNPVGAGLNTVRTSSPIDSPDLPGFPARKIAAIGNGWQYSDLQAGCEVLEITLHPSGEGDLDPFIGGAATLVVRDLAVEKSTRVVAVRPQFSTQFFGCSIADLEVAGGTVDSVTTFGCRRRQSGRFIAGSGFSDCVVKDVTAAAKVAYSSALGITLNFEDTIFQSIGLGIDHGGCAQLTACGIFDVDAPQGHGIFLYDLARLAVLNGLAGQGNSGYGIHVYRSTRLVYQGAKPTITGVSGEIEVTGVGIFLWADVPRSWNEWSGTATLGAGGTVAIPTKYLPADAKVTFDYNTLLGVPGNKLACPQATRANLGLATAQIVINSDNAGDLSSFDWRAWSPGTGKGGVFAH